MLKINKRYVINEKNERVAVQVDIATFDAIERVLEDYALAQQIEATRDEPALDRDAAKTFYKDLKRRNGK